MSWLSRLSWRSWLLSILIGLWDDICSVLQVINVIREEIILFRIYNGFNNFSCVISLGNESVGDDFHDIRDDGWEPVEDPIYSALGELLKIVVNLHQAFECGLSKLLQLWLDQVYKHIDRGETWDGITFVEDDGFLYVEIGNVISGSVVSCKFFVEAVEEEFNLSSSRDFSLSSV